MTQTDSVQRTLRQRLRAPQDAPPWSFGDLAILGIVVGLAMLIIAPVIALAPAPTTTTPTGSALIFGWSVGLILVTIFVLIRWRRTQELWHGLQLGASRRPLLIVLLAGIGAAFTSDLVAAAIASGFAPIAPLRGVDTALFGDVILAGVLVLIAQPIAEALIFAGVILPRLRASFGAWQGLWATAALFAGFHLLVYGAQLQTPQQLIGYGFVQPFIVGFVIAAARVDGASTRAAMIAHVGVGFSALLVLFIL